MCEGEGKEYNSIESLDKVNLSDLNNLEKILKNKSYIEGPIISIKDIETLENLDLLNINITKNNYPKIFQWKKDIERMKLNWKISKKSPNIKGKSFKEYIQIQTNKLSHQNIEQNAKMKDEIKFHENILKSEEKKDYEEIHFFTKKEDNSLNYILKILIKFCPDISLTYKDLSPKILIICNNHFVNKTSIEQYIDDKNKDNKCLNILVTSLIYNDEYNIENLSQDLKRNINGISSVSIFSLDKK